MPPASRATPAESPWDLGASSAPIGTSEHEPRPVLDALTPAAKGIPDATIARLPGYLRALTALAARDIATVSSGALAEAAGVNSAQLRKDLSHLGSYGTRGVGYDVEHLRFEIGREVGSASEWPVIIVGLGNLGTALANYSGFTSRGFRIVAMVDPSPDLIGTRIHDVAIADLADLENVVASTGARIAVLATPSEAAQDVADRLVNLGVTSILNFAASVLIVSDDVTVRKVDLGQELQILAYHEQRKSDELTRERPEDELTWERPEDELTRERPEDDTESSIEHDRELGERGLNSQGTGRRALSSRALSSRAMSSRALSSRALSSRALNSGGLNSQGQNNQGQNNQGSSSRGGRTR